MNRDTKLVYRINHKEDELTYMNDEWVHFAVANTASKLGHENILNRSLWDFIVDDTTKHLYREILSHVRSGRSVSFPFRCDAPEYRRYMEMTIIGLENGEVQFETRTLQAEARLRQNLLDCHRARTDALLRMCGWCKRVEVGEEHWAEVEEAITALHLFEHETIPEITHVICQSCFKSMTKKIAEQRARLMQG